MKFNHIPVLLEETINYLNIKENGIYVDGTLGFGGHSKEILKKLKNGRLIAIDQDEEALNYAKINLQNLYNNITFVYNNFSNIKNILFSLSIKNIDGMILDIGVSSYQLDNIKRGFSYMKKSPLDMRMDKKNNISAYDIVNFYEEEKLQKIIKNYGEEKWAKKIAYFICKYRNIKKIETTEELVNIIEKAIPKKMKIKGSHLAKRTFQAIRIEVNNELNILENTIKDIVDKLNKKARLCIITFHSLEDKIVKNTFKNLEKPCICPKEFPICICGNIPKIKIITKKPILPSKKEIENNSRSRSAKLRVIEKL